MLQHEKERTVKKDVKAYIGDVEGKEQILEHIKGFMDEKFDGYAIKYEEKKKEKYKEKLGWVLGTVATTLGILGSIGGLILLWKKITNKKDENI